MTPSMTPAALDISGVQALNGLAGRAVTLDAALIFAASGLIFVMVATVGAYVAAEWTYADFKGRVADAWHVICAFLLAFAVEHLIGYLWFRPRPFVVMQEVVKLIEKSPLEKSFPSGHATAAFAMAFALFLHDRKWGWLLIAMAVLVGLGRVAVGVHYPTDIIAGAVVGFAAAAATAPLRKRIEPYLELFEVFRKYKKSA